MSADIVNLNKARKKKARAEKDKRAQENRVRFGRTKAEREQDEALRTLEANKLAALRRGEEPDGDASS